MKAFSTIVFLLLALLGSSKIFAYANIAAQPKSLRYTYDDASYTEVQCKKPENAKESCVFTIAAKSSKKKTYTFSISEYGYSDSSALHAYSYWSTGGVAFYVSCQDKDYELLPDYKEGKLSDADLSFVQCFLFLYPDGNTLRPNRVEVTFYNAVSKMDYRKSRQL